MKPYSAQYGKDIFYWSDQPQFFFSQYGFGFSQLAHANIYRYIKLFHWGSDGLIFTSISMQVV